MIERGYMRLTFSTLGDDYDQSCTALTIAAADMLPAPTNGQVNWDFVLRRTESGWQEHVLPQIDAMDDQRFRTLVCQPTSCTPSSPIHMHYANVSEQAMDPDNLHLNGIMTLIHDASLKLFYGEQEPPVVGVVVISKSRQYGGYRVMKYSWRSVTKAPVTHWIYLCCEDMYSDNDELRSAPSDGTKWFAFGIPGRETPRSPYLLGASSLKRRIDASTRSLQLGLPFGASLMDPISDAEEQIATQAGIRSVGSVTSSERLGVRSSTGLGHNRDYLNQSVEPDHDSITASLEVPRPSAIRRAGSLINLKAHQVIRKRKTFDSPDATARPELSLTMAPGSAFTPSEALKTKFGRGTYIVLGPLGTIYPQDRFPPVTAKWLTEFRGRLVSPNINGLECCVESILAEQTDLARARGVLTWTDINDTCDECKTIGDRDCFVVIPNDIVIYKGHSAEVTQTTDDRTQGANPQSQKSAEKAPASGVQPPRMDSQPPNAQSQGTDFEAAAGETDSRSGAAGPSAFKFSFSGPSGKSKI